MSVKSAIEFRRTIKLYNPNCPIKESYVNDIVEAGRMAPSSMGLEPTQVLVIRNQEIKRIIAEQAMSRGNTELVKSADTLFVLTSYKREKFLNVEFLRSRIARRDYGGDDALNARINGCIEYMQHMPDLDYYGFYQAYIAVAYMSLQAADLNIGSTIMGGFDASKLDEILLRMNALNIDESTSVICLAIGKYNDHDPKAMLDRVRIQPMEFAR